MLVTKDHNTPLWTTCYEYNQPGNHDATPLSAAVQNNH